MKLTHPSILKIIDTDNKKINSVIIENQRFFSELCMDIYNQCLGYDGETVISIGDSPIDIGKYTELITQFVPFELNKKTLLNKVTAMANKLSVDPDYYESTMGELASIEKYLWNIVENLEGNISFSKLSMENIIKSIGLQFEDQYDCLGEKIIDYLELVRFYDRDKLFIFVNLRSFIDDKEAYELYDSLLRKSFNVIMIENTEYELLANEERLIIDSELCEIC